MLRRGEVKHERRDQRGRCPAVIRWPRALWIAGAPPWRGPCYASISDCPCFQRVGLTAILYHSEVKANEAKAMIDKFACGSRCSLLHSVVEVMRNGGTVLYAPQAVQAGTGQGDAQEPCAAGV